MRQTMLPSKGISAKCTRKRSASDEDIQRSPKRACVDKDRYASYEEWDGSTTDHSEAQYEAAVVTKPEFPGLKPPKAESWHSTRCEEVVRLLRKICHTARHATIHYVSISPQGLSLPSKTPGILHSWLDDSWHQVSAGEEAVGVCHWIGRAEGRMGQGLCGRVMVKSMI